MPSSRAVNQLLARPLTGVTQVNACCDVITNRRAPVNHPLATPKKGVFKIYTNNLPILTSIKTGSGNFMVPKTKMKLGKGGGD